MNDKIAKLQNERKLAMSKVAEIDLKIEEAKKEQEELSKNNKAIEKKIAEQAMKIWTRDRYPYSPDHVEARVTRYGKEIAVEIDISREYQSPEIKFSDLLALSQYFDGTERIGEVNDWANQGCETCDYGSSYGFIVRVLPKIEGGSIAIPSEGIEIK